MDTGDILNLIAIIVAPIAAVLIGQWLQDRSEKRKDKLAIFKTLMVSCKRKSSEHAIIILSISIRGQRRSACMSLLPAISAPFCSQGSRRVFSARRNSTARTAN